MRTTKPESADADDPAFDACDGTLLFGQTWIEDCRQFARVISVA